MHFDLHFFMQIKTYVGEMVFFIKHISITIQVVHISLNSVTGNGSEISIDRCAMEYLRFPDGCFTMDALVSFCEYFDFIFVIISFTTFDFRMEILLIGMPGHFRPTINCYVPNALAFCYQCMIIYYIKLC